MNRRQAGWIAINGGGVVYHDHLYGIHHVNESKDTCTLISLPYEWFVFNVPLDEITEESEYNWSNDD